MVISSHWLTSGTYVTCMQRPMTIHDFHGFPEELNTLTYPCPGAPDDSAFVAALLKERPVICNYDWGLDHASWTVLKHLFPEADIPVFEMSLDYSFNDWSPKPVQYYYDLASELSGLRKRGVLIIGSGNIVHNLSLLDPLNMHREPYAWAVEFDVQVKANLLDGNCEDLIRFRKMGSSSSLAVPTLDHYLPMIFLLGMKDRCEPLCFTHEGYQHGSISMRCFQIG
jgi:4,5-DOPA dioxygenase extradiol